MVPDPGSGPMIVRLSPDLGWFGVGEKGSRQGNLYDFSTLVKVKKSKSKIISTFLTLHRHFIWENKSSRGPIPDRGN